MPRALESPNCGAPLEVDGEATVAECHYCERHIVIAERKLTQAPAQVKTRAPAGAPARPTRQNDRKRGREDARSRTRTIALGVAFVVAIVATLGLSQLRKNAGVADEGDSRPRLSELELSVSPAEVERLFGSAVNGASNERQTTLDFSSPKSPVRRALLLRDLPDKAQLSGVELQYVGKAGVDAIVAKLREVTPHRVDQQNAQSFRVYVGDSVLDVSTTTVKVWHWSSIHGDAPDYGACTERLAAFWALARWAALDGAPLTEAQKKLVQGPSLAEATALPGDVSVEQAVEVFKKAVPSGWCRMQAGLMCVADTGDAHIREARWQWPNGLRAKAQRLQLQLAKEGPAKKPDGATERALAGCLDPVLGKAEEVVVDYVKGTRTFNWKIGDTATAVLQYGSLTFESSAAQPVDQPSAWSARIADVVSAIGRCKT
jgi:DNA-directed RNA polymerase subunit RPC12/RpoP